MRPDRAGVVFLVDDDPSVRRGLTRLLELEGYEVRAFASAEEFLSSGPVPPGPACLVLDVRMPGLSGQALHARLRAAEATLPVVYITGHGDIPMGIQAMKAGAVDFLPKPVRADQLLAAIAEALSRAERERRTQADAGKVRRRLETLTSREREVLDLVVRGRLNKQIAAELGIVEQTVKVHRGRLMRKMEADSVAELVRVMERLKGVDPT